MPNATTCHGAFWPATKNRRSELTLEALREDHCAIPSSTPTYTRAMIKTDQGVVPSNVRAEPRSGPAP